MRYPAALIAVAALLLAACGKDELVKPPKPPDVVRVPVVEYVTVPPELVRLMDPSVPLENSYDEAKRLALVRVEVIEEGNCRFLRIAKLGRPLGVVEEQVWKKLKCADRKIPKLGAPK